MKLALFCHSSDVLFKNVFYVGLSLNGGEKSVSAFLALTLSFKLVNKNIGQFTILLIFFIFLFIWRHYLWYWFAFCYSILREYDGLNLSSNMWRYYFSD